MKELKFRSWNDGFVFLDLMEDNDYDFYHFYCEAGDIVEQYTGLKDKNGKEIYEGDIVKQFVCKPSTIWRVGWNNEECCFELQYLKGSLFGNSMMADDNEYEIIGNIHENPELLGGEE